MEDFDLTMVSRKSIQGIFALVSRTFFVQILSIASNFILTLYLSPSMFGVFFVVSAINVFLAYFQDIGLAATIIQKKEEPTKKELRTTFTIQQCLVLGIIIPAFLLSSQIEKLFHLNTAGIYILYAYFVSFFLSSLKTIPTVLLERKLEFHKLVIPQITESVVYSSILIVLAIKGFGLYTFTIAILGRSLVGLPIIYAIQPWDIGLAFDKSIFKSLVSKGSLFQANSILGLFKDDLLNLYIATTLPIAQIGYVGFGQKWAFQPLRLIMDNVIKVTFPAYSRLQNDKDALKAVVEKSLFLIMLFIAPIIVIIVMFAPFFISYIPRYQKWSPAIVSLVFFSLNTLVASISVPLTNFLNAIGFVKITVKYMVFWTLLTWALTTAAIRFVGYNGVSIASFLVAASVLLILFPVKKYLKFSFVNPIKKQFFAAISMVIFILLLKPLITSLFSTFLFAILAGGWYSWVIFLLDRNEIVKNFIFLKNVAKK